MYQGPKFSLENFTMYQGPKFSQENLVVDGSRIEVIRYKLDVVWCLVLIFSSRTCSIFQSSMMAMANDAT